jgi:AAA15 family ATPase/GTPase
MSTYNEFYKWIEQLDSAELNDIDCKLINILIDNFSSIEPLSTAGGKRAKKLSEIISLKHETTSSVLNISISEEDESKGNVSRIVNMKVGPFRGFLTEEKFTFEKKYTFIYGPNGSGKSSFCEGLELALLGDVEEAREKRIKLSDYIENAEVKKSENPKAFGKNEKNKLVEIIPNSQLYRFSFFEKNRIDGFARITAETANTQKDRIATLFGLESFNKFVDGFTENFDRYLSIENIKEKKFAEVSKKYEQDKSNLQNLLNDVEKCKLDMSTLINEINQEDVNTKEDLFLLLKGDENKQGYLDELQKKIVEPIPDNQDVKEFDEILLYPDRMNTNIACFKKSHQALTKEASKVDYKDLYNSILSLKEHQEKSINICPACKTPLYKVVVNPYDNAVAELEKLKNISELQADLKSSGENIIRFVKIFKVFINRVCVDDEIKEDFGIYSDSTEMKLEDLYDDMILNQLSLNGEGKDSFVEKLKKIKKNIETSNKSRSEIRGSKSKIKAELKKFQGYNEKFIGINSRENDYYKKIEIVKKSINEFEKANEKNLKEIKCEKEIISIKKQYLVSYIKLISNLKKYRLNLPKELASGLSAKVKEYYNVINSHDPDFELIESLILPIKSGDKISLRFQGEKVVHDALYILSEGHIKVLGLSILLAKAVKENLGFLIYDDIVNAIDDDHRSGIAELLMRHQDFIERQHILTCHGEQFINKLEHKLGASLAAKEVKRYRFVPLDLKTERGIKISIGDPKHYLLQAKVALDNDSRKKAASSCRQAVESIAEKLWKKISKEKNISLSVKLRGPGSKPDLASLIDSLIKVLGKIDKSAKVYIFLKELQEKYNWNLLNKGTHEEGGLPEFDREDVVGLYQLVTKIEAEAINIKFVTEVV